MQDRIVHKTVVSKISQENLELLQYNFREVKTWM